MANPFSDYLGDLGGSYTSMLGTTLSFAVKILAGVLLLGIVVWFILWKRKKKMFNIPVTIWIPRSDGKITDEVSGIGGYFRTKQREGGMVTTFRLKRKGISTLDIPPPASRFLVGLRRKLYLIQKGVDDFEPVLPESFRTVKTSDGRRLPVINLKCINQDATAWVEDNRENARRRFTFSGWWEKYKDFLQIIIFIFIVMLSLYINWVGLGKVVEGLHAVADKLVGGGGVSIG